MVRCSDNVFFDISNTDFTIDAAAAPDYTFSYNGGVQTACVGTAGSFNFVVNTASIGGYNDPLNLSVTSAPLGVNVAFSSNPINPGDDVTVTVSNYAGLSVGSYTVTVQSSSTAGNKSTDLDFSLSPAPMAPDLVEPLDGALDADLLPTLSWNSVSGATTYRLEVATDIAFSNVVETINTSNTSATLNNALTGATLYYWRVTSGSTECGLINDSTPRSFETESCYLYSFSGSVPISPGAPANYTATINVPDNGNITDVDLINLDITHTWVGDLQVQLESPGGTLRTLFSYDCGSSDDVLLSFDDEAADALSCPYNTGNKVRPEETLDAFDGQLMNGSWMLRVRDNADQDGGNINGWNLKVCTNNFNALPVEWLMFRATAEQEHVLLYWQTTAEVDNAGFELERRAEHEEQFKPIGWVDPKTEGSAVNDYYYQDQEVRAGITYYYRIRQLDYSGSYSYSAIQAVQMKGELPQWQFYPNPVQDQLQVRVWNTTDVIELRVYNSQGQLQWYDQDTGTNEQTLDLSNWPRGVYWLQFKAGPWTHTERLLKL